MKGHIAGPCPSPPLPDLHYSGVGVVPKKDNSWHMIMHLLAPSNHSINDGIDKESFLLYYSTIDDVTNLISISGHESSMYLAKINLKGAFCLFPLPNQTGRSSAFIGRINSTSINSSPLGCAQPLISLMNFPQHFTGSFNITTTLHT